MHVNFACFLLFIWTETDFWRLLFGSGMLINESEFATEKSALDCHVFVKKPAVTSEEQLGSTPCMDHFAFTVIINWSGDTYDILLSWQFLQNVVVQILRAYVEVILLGVVLTCSLRDQSWVPRVREVRDDVLELVWILEQVLFLPDQSVIEIMIC